MRIEKKTLNDALRVLGKVVCQTSPVELYRSVRLYAVAAPFKLLPHVRATNQKILQI